MSNRLQWGVTLEGIGGEGYADYRRQVCRAPSLLKGWNSANTVVVQLNDHSGIGARAWPSG